MIKLDMAKFREDLQNDTILKDIAGTYSGTHINLSRYIFQYQHETKMWHWINMDRGVNYYFDGNTGYMEVDSYGYGTPNWAYAVIKDMEKVIQSMPRGFSKHIEELI